MNPDTARVSLLHTRFLFPFSIDVEAVMEAHPDIWASGRPWISGLDEWICGRHARTESPVLTHLGGWERSPYQLFDMDSRGYQDLAFFHPFTRRVFFDMVGQVTAEIDREALLRYYRIPAPASGRLLYEIEDLEGGSASVTVDEVRLFLFANGIGILSLGIEASDLEVRQALWINESMRKVYPSSGRQVREGRAPYLAAFALEREGQVTRVLEHDFREGKLQHLLPPLTKTITGLLYFLDYAEEEYEPVLDERMIVYTYLSLDPAGLPEGFRESEDYQVLLSRILYVDRAGSDYRYEPAFIREQMKKQLYTRWAHQGTYYGFTGYSAITVTIGAFECGRHKLAEGFVVHRMFESRYYIMAVIALFYRATLLDSSERVALVSKRLYLDQWYGRYHLDNIRLTDRVRAEFVHFNTHWYFDELTNKDEECEHFQMQCEQYRTEVMRADIEKELDAINASLHNYYQFRNTEAVNRLAMLSMILGGGAVITGFFGMNFEHHFGILLKPVAGLQWIYWASLGLVTAVAFGAMAFGVWTIAANWPDYRNTLVPKRLREGWAESKRLRKAEPGSRR